MKGLVVLAAGIALIGLPLGTALSQQTQPQQTQPQQTQPQQTEPQQAPPPQSPGGGGSQTGVGQSGLTIASDSLVGTKVRDPQGKELGEVSKLMIDPQQGNVTSVIIRHGGTLGMGGKEIAVPWDALKVQRGQDQQLVVTMQQQMLEQTPRTEQQKPEGQAPAASPPARSQEQPRQR